MSDIATIWDVQRLRGDWVLDGTLLKSGDELVTWLLISLFTDRIAGIDDVIPDGSNDPRGWCLDDPDRPIGSRLWLLERAKAPTDETKNRAIDYITEAVQWMLDDGMVAKWNISADWVRGNMLGCQVTGYHQDGTTVAVAFDWAWNIGG